MRLSCERQESAADEASLILSAAKQGRLDAAVFTEKWGHVIEIKLDQSADAAMRQVHGRGCCRKYLKRKRPIMLLALGVNTDDWKAEKNHKKPTFFLLPGMVKPPSPCQSGLGLAHNGNGGASIP